MKDMKEHNLKCLQPFFDEAWVGKKNFELRKDDRDFSVGDRIYLQAFDGEKLTGEEIFCTIKYILRDCPQFGLMPGYCILGLK